MNYSLNVTLSFICKSYRKDLLNIEDMFKHLSIHTNLIHELVGEGGFSYPLNPFW